MLKFVVLALLIVALLLPAPVQAAPDTQTCILTTHIVGRVYLRNGTSRVETVGDIAAAYNTSSSRIRSLNPGMILSPLMVGQQINVWDCDSQLPDSVATPRSRPRATPVPRGTPWPGFRCLLGICSR